VKVALACVEFVLAVTVVESGRLTRRVSTVNTYVVLPAKIVTDGGSVATNGFDELSVTTVPPAVAGPSSVILQTVVRKPTTVDGVNEIDVSEGALTVSTC